MEFMEAPHGPSQDFHSYEDIAPFSFPPAGVGGVEEGIEKVVGVLILPIHYLPKAVSLDQFAPQRSKIEKLHQEVHYCIWSMSIALLVYVRLLNLVDMDIRRDVSDKVSQFLADWKGGKSHALIDALDALVISEFTKRGITPVPDMVRLQKDHQTNWALLSSTVASYLKDIAVRLSNARHCDIDSAIDIIFPSSKNFIGRCFFHRLAVVASELLDLVQVQESSDASSASTLTSP
jgi:hypothetical protein